MRLNAQAKILASVKELAVVPAGCWSTVLKRISLMSAKKRAEFKVLKTQLRESDERLEWALA